MLEGQENKIWRDYQGSTEGMDGHLASPWSCLLEEFSTSLTLKALPSSFFLACEVLEIEKFSGTHCAFENQRSCLHLSEGFSLNLVLKEIWNAAPKFFLCGQDLTEKSTRLLAFTISFKYWWPRVGKTDLKTRFPSLNCTGYLSMQFNVTRPIFENFQGMASTMKESW